MTNWKEIHLDFTEELQKDWENKGFSYEQCKEWVDIDLKIEDADYACWLRNVKNIDILVSSNKYRESKEKFQEEYEFLRLFEEEFNNYLYKEETKEKILKKIDEAEASTLDSIVANIFQEWNIKHFDIFVSQDNENYAILVNQGFLYTVRLVNYAYDSSTREIEIISKKRFPDENVIGGGYVTLEQALRSTADIKKGIERKEYRGDDDLTNINEKDKTKFVEENFVSPLVELLKDVNFSSSPEFSIVSKTKITDYTDIPQALSELKKALNNNDIKKKYDEKYGKLTNKKKEVI